MGRKQERGAGQRLSGGTDRPGGAVAGRRSAGGAAAHARVKKAEHIESGGSVRFTHQERSPPQWMGNEPMSENPAGRLDTSEISSLDDARQKPLELHSEPDPSGCIPGRRSPPRPPSIPDPPSLESAPQEGW